MFARMTPGSTVAPHSDGRNFILTCHLGLDVPEQGCWIEAAGQRKEWEEGKAIVLDTSFTHSTANQSDRDRYVLIIDFWVRDSCTRQSPPMFCASPLCPSVPLL